MYFYALFFNGRSKEVYGCTVQQKMSDPKCEIISFDNSKYILRYRDKLFKYDNACTCEIIEEEIEIKDKFGPMDV